MTDELKPVRCGCGGEAWTDYIIGEPSEGVGWFVCCKNCEIQLPPEYSTESEAITAWNRAMGADAYKTKATERTAGKWIDGMPYVNSHWKVCSECHVSAPDSCGGFNFCPHCGADMRGEHE